MKKSILPTFLKRRSIGNLIFEDRGDINKVVRSLCTQFDYS